MDKIPLKKLKEKIGELLDSHLPEIEEIWKKDQKVGLALSVKFSIKDGRNECGVGISFIKGRVRANTLFVWDERQMEFEIKGRVKK